MFRPTYLWCNTTYDLDNMREVRTEQIGKGNNSTESLGECLEGQKHTDRNKVGVTDMRTCIQRFTIPNTNVRPGW